MFRRGLLFVPALIALAAVGAVLGSGASTADDQPARGPLVSETVREAIDMGTRYLVRLQNEDGSWSSDAGKKINERYDVFQDGRTVPHVGVTSLAVLAMLAGGHRPARGPHGKAMSRAVGFILDQVNPQGYIASNGTRMYSHAFATLALAEVYGVSRKQSIRNRLQDAIEFTVKCQNETGGWRYVPFTNDSDMSVTVCQVVALRAARNAGIKVPQATIDRALRYIIESMISEEDRGPPGAFWYQPHDHKFNRPSFALCAAGLTALFQAGLYDDEQVRGHIATHDISRSPPPTIRQCVEYMKRSYWRIWQRNPNPDHYFYFYGNYYAAQAMYQIGGRDPSEWEVWYRQVSEHLLKRMRQTTEPESGQAEAYWVSNVDRTNAYATACALLILQFPLDYLPIHQR